LVESCTTSSSSPKRIRSSSFF